MVMQMLFLLLLLMLLQRADGGGADADVLKSVKVMSRWQNMNDLPPHSFLSSHPWFCIPPSVILNAIAIIAGLCKYHSICHALLFIAIGANPCRLTWYLKQYKFLITHHQLQWKHSWFLACLWQFLMKYKISFNVWNVLSSEIVLLVFAFIEVSHKNGIKILVLILLAELGELTGIL